MLAGFLGMAATAAAAGASAGSSAPPTTTFDGATWYQVSTPAELEYIDQNQSQYLEANIELMADVSLAGADWTPFGSCANSSAVYGGTFNGNGYSVTGLDLTDSADDCVAFLGEVTGTVENLTVSGSLTADGSHQTVGGLVGILEGTIEDSGANVTVTGDTGSAATDTAVGGLAGYVMGDSVIEDSYATGTVEDGDYTGGLVGDLYTGTVENCYATGDVSEAAADGGAGGLVGDLHSGTVEDSYATGNATATGSSSLAGAILGFQDFGTLDAVLYDSSGASALTAVARTQGWNFTRIWGTSASLNGGFPYLQWQFPPTPTPSTPPPTLTTGSVPVGSGTASVIENMGYNSPDAIANGTSAGYVEERTALQAGVTFGGEGTDSSYLSDILAGTGVDLADPNVSPEQQGTFAALYQKLGIIPTWTDNTVSIGAGVAALEKAKASDLALENYLVQLDGFTWAAAEAEAAAGFPIGQTT